MGVLWFWLLLVLLLVAVAALPSWPYSRRWGWGPSGGALIAFLVFLGLIWFDFLAIWRPWGPR